MVTLLHISDLHFGTSRARVIGEAVLRTEAEVRPDAVVCSGDLVEWSESGGPWREVRGFLRRIGSPLVVTPGNHDIERLNLWNRLVRPLGRYRESVGRDVDTVTEVPGAVIVGLGTPRRWSVHLGHVSRAQLELLARSFARAGRGVVRAVVLHHGLEQAAPGLVREHVWGARRLRRALHELGVHLVMSGHGHFAHARRMVSEGGAFVWAQAGTVGSRRFGGGNDPRNSISVIRATAEQVAIEWWHYAEDVARFMRGGSVELATAGPDVALPVAGLLPEGSPA